MSQAGDSQPKRGFQLPSAYTILFSITVIVAILTWIVPAGLYQADENGRPRPGSFTRVEASPQGIKAILGAPINGMYGVRSDPGKVNAHGEMITLVDQGTVSVYNQGRLFGAIGVAFFIILLGAFITMAMETGAITTGVAALGHSLRARGPLLIAVLIVIFAIGGSTYGMAEESVGFIAIVTALVMILGYDTITGLAIVLVGTAVGRIAGTVNPFSIGVASDAAGISPGDGIGLRLTLFVVLVTITIIYVLRYASRVKADPSRSVVADQRDEHYRHFVGERAAGAGAAVLDGRQKMVLVVFALTGQAIVEGVLLARYRYDALRREPRGTRVRELALVAPSGRVPQMRRGAERGRVFATAMNLTRDLANTPHSHLSASRLANLAVALGKQHGFAVEVFDKDALVKLGIAGLLGINQGSVEPPRMIKLTYGPKRGASGRLALVGKGIMYDAGGIALKPADRVHAQMKNDMSGAAAILAAFTSFTELGCTASVTGYLMCTDNMPSGSALALGDVLTHRDGTTVEIFDTDAEGRLVLADALVLAREPGE
jgi:Cytosol aminopeptidase family, catalytic domain/C4-dicarboxylate anaerobic carrier